MKKYITLSLFILCPFFMMSPAFAEANLEDTMDAINDDYKLVGRALKAGANADDKDLYLEALQRIQLGMLSSKVMVPTRATTPSAADKAKMVNDYRLEMIQAVIALLQVESDILNDDYTAAAASFDKLKESKKRGHNAYQEEDE